LALFLSCLSIILPWSLRVRMLAFLRKILDFIVLNFKFTENFIMRRTEKSRSVFLVDKNIMKKNDFFNDCKREEVSVMFSGGSDSTLAAIKLIGKFKKVHLVTFYFWPIAGIRGAILTGEKLITKYGRDKVQHKIFLIDDMFKDVYHKSLWKDFLKFKLFVENICAYCKLTMLYRLLIFNIENEIKYVASGSSYEGAPFFAEQMPRGAEVVNELFSKYGKIFFAPVFHVRRTDHELYRLGFTKEKEKKFPAPDFDKYQVSCDLGVIHHIYCQGYFVPCHGLEKLADISCDFIKEKNKMFEYLRKKYSGEIK